LESYPWDFRWLLRLGENAGRKEQSAKREGDDFFVHVRSPDFLRSALCALRSADV
jgi:hypothetical protein